MLKVRKIIKIMKFLTKIFGDPNIASTKSIDPIVVEINALEEKMQALSIEELKSKTKEFKDRLSNKETLDDILPEAFAVVREVSKRITGMRHYDVQLVGGVVLHQGKITEMRTGEGKTLVATLPVYLNALSGKGVHVVTVNDYLAKRDAVWMAQIYDSLGMSVGIIQNLNTSFKYNANKIGLEEGSEADEERDKKGMFKVEDEYLVDCERADAYQCDIVYGTNNEFGFDYLRDNMVGDLKQMVQRPFYFAIVDEVDSILIDEARTPLIISAPSEEAGEMYYQFSGLVKRLKENDDYNIDEKMRAATLTDPGIKKIEGWLGVENIYAEGGIKMVHHVEQALKARALFKRDRDYVVENDEVVIVDEFTGRKMPGRRYSEGLHQAIEAQEGVKIQKESRTMATITFQNYFRMYKKLGGMTGTAVTEAEEFNKIYGLEVSVIPTNKEIDRTDHADKIYNTEDAKLRAIAKRVKELQGKGQPVLIGTVSVEKNELLGMYLDKEGVNYEALNAKNHEREGEIVAQAGANGSVTLATNMAGRGVDIILGGNPPDEKESQKIKDLGGLYVVGTERHESRRIDNQLRGRAGRQGDPGETEFYLSTDDDLMRIFAGDRIKSIMKTLKVPEDTAIEHKTLNKVIESAQKKVEGFHFDSRKHLLEYDDVLNRHREVVYKKRREVLEVYEDEKKEGDTKKTLRDLIFEMIEGEIENFVSFHTNGEDHKEWNMQEVYETAVTIFPISGDEKQKILDFKTGGDDKLDEVKARTNIIEYLMEVANKKYEETLVTKVEDQKMMFEIEKQILIRSIDNLWIDHLVAIDYLRTGIGLRGYGQRDPLVEYKKETYHMFNELLALIQKEVVYSIYKVGLGLQMAPSVMEKSKMVLKGAEKNSVTDKGNQSNKVRNEEGEKVGRNDPCPCGSGKKYKKCCGK